MRKYLFLLFALIISVPTMAQDQQSVFENLRGTVWKRQDKNIYWGFSKDNSSVYVFSDNDNVIGSMKEKRSWNIDEKGKLIYAGLEPLEFKLIPHSSFNIFWDGNNRFTFYYVGAFRSDPPALDTPNPLAGKAISITSADFHGVIMPYFLENGEPGIKVTFHTTVINPNTGYTDFSLWIKNKNGLLESNEPGYNTTGNMTVNDICYFFNNTTEREFRNRSLFLPYSVLKNAGFSGWQDFELLLRVYNSNKKELQKTSWMPVKVYIP